MSGFEKIVDRQIATRFAVSVASTRTQTKSVFQKTGAHRPVERAAPLAGFPQTLLR
jgi:hypothetical protein